VHFQGLQPAGVADQSLTDLVREGEDAQVDMQPARRHLEYDLSAVLSGRVVDPECVSVVDRLQFRIGLLHNLGHLGYRAKVTMI